jgi:DNA-binding XRE family transcriptional regulator
MNDADYLQQQMAPAMPRSRTTIVGWKRGRG